MIKAAKVVCVDGKSSMYR